VGACIACYNAWASDLGEEDAETEKRSHCYDCGSIVDGCGNNGGYAGTIMIDADCPDSTAVVPMRFTV
jgi:hypothetical protein